MAQRAAKEGVGLLKQTFQDFSEDECPMRAAALSYYTVFALPPLLILLLLIAGAVFDPQQVQDAIQTHMGSLMGSEGAQEIGNIIRQAERPGGRTTRTRERSNGEAKAGEDSTCTRRPKTRRRASSPGVSAGAKTMCQV